MRRLAIGAVAVVVLAAAPATAQEPVPTPPCDPSAEYATLGPAGKHEDVETPLIPGIIDGETQGYQEYSIARYQYRLDVSGSVETPTATIADVGFVLRWDNDSDFDLYIYDGDGNELGSSAAFNPQDGSGESVSLFAVSHCTDLRVEIVNWLGLPTSTIDLDVTVSGLA